MDGESQSEALLQTMGFLFLSLFALAQGCAEPQQTVNTIHLFIKFHFLEKKVYRKLLCSRHTQSWFEGCGWEAKWKAFQIVSMLTGSLAFSKPNEKKKFKNKIKKK